MPPRRSTRMTRKNCKNRSERRMEVAKISRNRPKNRGGQFGTAPFFKRSRYCEKFQKVVLKCPPLPKKKRTIEAKMMKKSRRQNGRKKNRRRPRSPLNFAQHPALHIRRTNSNIYWVMIIVSIINKGVDKLSSLFFSVDKIVKSILEMTKPNL